MAISPTPEIPVEIKNLNDRLTALSENINQTMLEINSALTTGFNNMSIRFNTVDGNVGAVKSDTAAIKALIEALTSGGIQAVKRVQRGEAYIANDNTDGSVTETLTYLVNVDKCLVILNGSGSYSSYEGSAASVAYGYNRDPGYELTSTSLKIIASSRDFGESSSTTIQWQIIEFN